MSWLESLCICATVVAVAGGAAIPRDRRGRIDWKTALAGLIVFAMLALAILL